MDFALSTDLIDMRDRFLAFLEKELVPRLGKWHTEEAIPREFFLGLAQAGWLGFDSAPGVIEGQSVTKQALLFDALARSSPGVAIAVVVHVSLGMKGLSLYGSEGLKEKYLQTALRGETLLCLGNTEPAAGTDVAGIASTAQKVDGGWVLSGTKAYVTNGSISDAVLVTAVSDPENERNKRLSMFLVDLTSPGITRTKLNKRVWIPSDLTRIQFRDAFVPDEHLVGDRGRGLQQVLDIFNQSRLSISALTLGTARGAFQLALDHARKRKVFGVRLADFQVKSFEMADLFARMEAAELMLWKACWERDAGMDFRMESSMAKYLSVEIAREVSAWAADLFGAASVLADHPIHKFPMDAWASSLGEGTQDVQKLIIFRELMKRESAWS